MIDRHRRSEAFVASAGGLNEWTIDLAPPRV